MSRETEREREGKVWRRGKKGKAGTWQTAIRDYHRPFPSLCRPPRRPTGCASRWQKRGGERNRGRKHVNGTCTITISSLFPRKGLFPVVLDGLVQPKLSFSAPSFPPFKLTSPSPDPLSLPFPASPPPSPPLAPSEGGRRRQRLAFRSDPPSHGAGRERQGRACGPEEADGVDRGKR